jgi:ubiquinone/menaquinone biosynthesis C-methylase UbiE
MQPQDYAYLYELEDSFWWFAGMREITAALLDPICLTDKKDLRVLDAGCGTGGNLAWLRRYTETGSVIGIDLSAEAVNFCQRSGQANLARASVTALPFADASFDLITSFDVLAYPSGLNADTTALREMHRVLRPDGIGFVRVAAYKWMYGDHDRATHAQRRYSVSSLNEKMQQAGFDVLRATSANTWLLPLAIVRRLILKPIGIVDGGSDVKPLSRNLKWLNGPLRKVLASEACLLRHFIARLPFGLSAICIVKKRSAD